MREKIMRQLSWLLVGEVVLNILILGLLVTLYVTENMLSENIRILFYISIGMLMVLAGVLMFFLGRFIFRGIFRSVHDLEEAGEQADTLTREVVSNITHDLKTPLTAIKGYSQGILDGVAGTPERLNKYVTTIRNKADDMAGLVDELSFFTQIYQKDIQYQCQEVNASDYFSGCVSDLSLDLEMKKISLVYQYEADPDARICIDTEKMKRVINNIIGNASKYIQTEMGIVFVCIKETQEDMIIQVTDNGVGIAEEELPRIFERFYRTDNSRNSKTGGSGLGLAIAKKITEDHKGKIWAESELGKGTKITFSLPKLIDG